MLRELQADTAFIKNVFNADLIFGHAIQSMKLKDAKTALNMISADRTHTGLGKEKQKLCATIFGKMMHDLDREEQKLQTQIQKTQNLRKFLFFTIKGWWHHWIVPQRKRDMMPFFDAEMPSWTSPQWVITRETQELPSTAVQPQKKQSTALKPTRATGGNPWKFSSPLGKNRSS